MKELDDTTGSTATDASQVWERYAEYCRSAPEIVVEWNDPLSPARGWLVINSLRGGAAGGGTRMLAGVTREEVTFLAKAMELAELICQNGPLAVRAAKEAACRGYEMTLEQGLALEARLSGEVLRPEDAREGPLAFAQKRKPEYKGR
jgi:hypothetical protein